MKYFILILLVLAACGKKDVPVPPPAPTPPELQFTVRINGVGVLGELNQLAKYDAAFAKAYVELALSLNEDE